MRVTEDKAFAALRALFGVVWAIDASFKWQPAFVNNFVSYLTDGAQGQPPLVQWWIELWIRGVSVDPHFFAIVVALAESAIALGLVFGVLTRLAIGGGIAMALVIWTTAEGFGGPYAAGSTDIGTAIIYVIVFFALYLGKCWRHFSVDAWLKGRNGFSLGSW